MSDKPRNQIKRRILPGLWFDMEDNAHFSIPEILAHLGMPDTPENHVLMRKAINDVIKREQPDAKIINRETPDE